MFASKAGVLSFAFKNFHKNYIFSTFLSPRTCSNGILPPQPPCFHTSSNVDISYKKLGVTVTETETSEQDKCPVVVLLGWMDSKDSHIKKYSDIFTQKNFGTVRTTVNMFDTLFRSGTKVKQIGYDILRNMDEMHCEERSVFLYPFSYGGSLIFFHIMEALTTPENKYFGKFNVVGSIFDSCPIDPTGPKFVRSSQRSTEHVSPNPVYRRLAWLGVTTFLPLMMNFNPTVQRYMDGVKKPSLTSEQLVLYSKVDRIAPYQDIEDYIDARRALGVRVVAKCWEKSAHVSHYRANAEEYLKLVDDFVEACLKNNVHDNAN